MYLLEDTPEARAAMGSQVDIVEDQDGEVLIQHKGRPRHTRAFDTQGHVSQAAIVDNKLLAGALKYAKEQQEQRDGKR